MELVRKVTSVHGVEPFQLNALVYRTTLRRVHQRTAQVALAM